MPAAHGVLMQQLPWPVLARLLSAVFTERIRTTNSRDWLEIRQDPKSARWLWGAFSAFLVATVLGIVIFASFWQVEMLRGAVHVGLSWFFVLSCCVFVGSLVFLILLLGLLMTGTGDSDTVIAWLFLGGFTLLVGIALDAVESEQVLNGWLGPAATTYLFVGVIAVTTLFCWLASRRARRYGNPLRHCVKASGRSFADRTSVIAQ